MRIEPLMISFFLLACNTVGCSQPEPVEAQYEPADCNCTDQTPNAGQPPATTSGLSGSQDKGSSTAVASADDKAGVPAAGLAADNPSDSGASGSTPSSQATSDSAPSPTLLAQATDGADAHQIVNINTASVDQLMTLPGVGPALAGRIVQFRQKRPFEKPAHLRRVKGIGEATFAKIAPMVTVTGATSVAK